VEGMGEQLELRATLQEAQFILDPFGMESRLKFRVNYDALDI
jgi:hypothetical protein